jgi:hypothetical protein
MDFGDTSGDTSPNVTLEIEPAMSAAQRIFLDLDQSGTPHHRSTPTLTDVCQ